MPAGIGAQQDFVFAPKAGQGRNTGQSESTDNKSPGGYRHLFIKSAHFPDILFIRHGMNNTAGAEEQKALEKGMGHQMEHTGSHRPYPHGHDHITQLAQGGVG